MLSYQDLKLPIYRNTRVAYANLDTTDLAIAAVLAPLNLLLPSNTGKGKSQLAQDIYRNYFGGNMGDNGNGIFIRAHPDIDVYNEIFTELDIQQAQRRLTKNIGALIYFVDELNRAPPVMQNQFFGLGDGVMDYKGTTITLGRDGYRFLIATANLGNGEFQGTFETDKALYNRLHVTIDLDHEAFNPTRHDEMTIDKMTADPNVKMAPLRDISDEIIAASKQIALRAADPGLEALAVVNYLRFGLEHCLKNGTKGKVWPLDCQECEHNEKSDALCSVVRSPVRRTMNAMIRYAAALQYLAQLKQPNLEVDVVDLMFKSFELTGAYQHLLNPQTLRITYKDQNPKMMADAAERLKAEYRKNESFIKASIFEAQRGRKVTRFVVEGKNIADYDDYRFTELGRKKAKPVEPYNDKGQIGMKWVEDFIEFNMAGSSESAGGGNAVKGDLAQDTGSADGQPNAEHAERKGKNSK